MTQKIDTGLDDGHYSTDFLLLHMAFELLRRFVEVEFGGLDAIQSEVEVLVSDISPMTSGVSAVRAAALIEVEDLYRWWMVERPRHQAEQLRLQDKLSDTGSLGEDTGVIYVMISELDEQIAREEHEMLHRLVDVRRCLWT